jgi:hypothetical protein
VSSASGCVALGDTSVPRLRDLDSTTAWQVGGNACCDGTEEAKKGGQRPNMVTPHSQLLVFGPTGRGSMWHIHLASLPFSSGPGTCFPGEELGRELVTSTCRRVGTVQEV